MYIPLYLIIFPMIKNHDHVCHRQELFYATVFYLRLNPYISNISNIYNPGQNLSLTSQTIGDHMFLDPKLYYKFHVFWLCTWIIFFLIVCDNCSLTLNMGRCWNPL